MKFQCKVLLLLLFSLPLICSAIERKNILIRVNKNSIILESRNDSEEAIATEIYTTILNLIMKSELAKESIVVDDSGIKKDLKYYFKLNNVNDQIVAQISKAS